MTSPPEGDVPGVTCVYEAGPKWFRRVNQRSPTGRGLRPTIPSAAIGFSLFTYKLLPNYTVPVTATPRTRHLQITRCFGLPRDTCVVLRPNEARESEPELLAVAQPEEHVVRVEDAEDLADRQRYVGRWEIVGDGRGSGIGERGGEPVPEVRIVLPVFERREVVVLQEDRVVEAESGDAPVGVTLLRESLLDLHPLLAVGEDGLVARHQIGFLQ